MFEVLDTLTHIQKLDHVFDIIHRRWRITDSELTVRARNVGINAVEYGNIIDRLTSDGLIKYSDKYHIVTSKGEEFHRADGSYSNNLKERKTETRSKILREWLMIGGSWSAAFGLFANAMSYLAHRGLHWLLTIKFLTVSILFLVGMLTGIATLLVAKEVLQRKDR